jgi:hypothetical protein
LPLLIWWLIDRLSCCLPLIYSFPININKSLGIVRPSSVTSGGPCQCNFGGDLGRSAEREDHIWTWCILIQVTLRCAGSSDVVWRGGLPRGSFLFFLFPFHSLCFCWKRERQWERSGHWRPERWRPTLVIVMVISIRPTGHCQGSSHTVSTLASLLLTQGCRKGTNLVLSSPPEMCLSVRVLRKP